MMLQHRSGIPDFIDNPDYPWGKLPEDSKDILEFALDLPADFEPDEDYGQKPPLFAFFLGLREYDGANNRPESYNGEPGPNQ